MAIRRLVDLYAAWGKPEKTEEYRRLLKSSREPVEKEQPEESRTPVRK